MIRRYEQNRLKSRRRFNESEIEEGSVIYSAPTAHFSSIPYEDGDLSNEYETTWNVEIGIEATSLKELFEKVKNAIELVGYSLEDSAWEVEISDENGFVNKYLSDEDGNALSKKQIKTFRNNGEDMWSNECYVHIQRTVKTSEVPDDELKDFARKNRIRMS